MTTKPAGKERRDFLFAAGLGVAALVGGAQSAEAAEWSDAEKANVKTVNDFCAAVSARDFTRVLPFLADDVAYRMTETTPAIIGHEAISARYKSFIEGSATIEFRVLETFAAGPIVINHRIDHFAMAQPFTWEGVGVFFVKDGKIKEWSDYTIRMQR